MKSIADHHRREEARALAALSADERVALTFQLGDDDLEIYRQARDLSHAEARRALRRARQAGRVRCACLEEPE
jgi:hypothetical protein